METPNDRKYYNGKTDVERAVQVYMNAWYQKYGYEIVSRAGNRKRDLVLSRNGITIQVEEKFREKDYGDFLVEIIQDAISYNPGWFYAERFDRLSYVILDGVIPKTIYWINWDKFKEWYFNYIKEHRIAKAIISPAGYGLTINISIPWKSIPHDIVIRYNYDSSKG